MSVLVVGLSHRSAPVPLLEKVSAGLGEGQLLLDELRASGPVSEAVVLATCNRVEVYADSEGFHAGVDAVSDLLARLSGVPLDELARHLYVHWEGQAVLHLFRVACGLDSMVIGESQILGQIRRSYAATLDGAGPTLHELFQRALNVGKRAHTETGIDEAGRSLVSVGLERAVGAVGALDGRGIGLDALESALVEADVVVASTGATGVVVPGEVVARAVAARGGRPLAILDLALPRDIDPSVRDLPGVTLIDLETLQQVLETTAAGSDVEAVRGIVTEEVGRFLASQRAARVAPTVVALRSRADQVVEAELARLEGRLPELDDRARTEVEVAVRRVVDKLLHTPTVRVKELTDAPEGLSYADALRELFGLDRAAPAAVTATPLAVESVEDQA